MARSRTITRCSATSVAAALILAVTACADDPGGDATDVPPSGAATTATGATPVSTASPSSTAPPTSATSSSTAPGGAEAQVRLELVVDGLAAPIAMVVPPGEEDRRLVVDQAGVVVEIGEDDTAAPEPFLDVRDRIVELHQTRDDERGLLGLVFHPDYQQNQRVFAFYTERPGENAPSTLDHVNVLSEFQVGEDGAAVDPGSERRILEFDQDGSSHAAGQLQFDDDGQLLVFVGDGLRSDESQSLTSRFGKVLRIDVDGRGRARVNQFAMGLRHPWRISFDEPSGQTFIVEPNFESRFQEVNVLERGANYGWKLDIPPSCYPDGGPLDPECERGPNGEVLTPPVAEYGPEFGLIVSGARIYRGTEIPALTGKLVITEWGVSSIGTGTQGTLLVADATGEAPWQVGELPVAEDSPGAGDLFWGLGADGAGELYVLAMADIAPVDGDGAVYRIVAA